MENYWQPASLELLSTNLQTGKYRLSANYNSKTFFRFAYQ